MRSIWLGLGFEETTKGVGSVKEGRINNVVDDLVASIGVVDMAVYTMY